MASRQSSIFPRAVLTVSTIALFSIQGIAPGQSGTGNCLQFPNQPIVSGNILDLEQSGEQRYLVIPVCYSDEEPIFSMPSIESHRNECALTLGENSYGRIVPVFEIVDPIKLPLTMEEYGAEKNARLRPDILTKANLWLQHNRPAWHPLETNVDREIFVFKTRPGPATSAAYRSVYANETVNGYVWSHELGHTYGWEHANFLRDEDPSGGFSSFPDNVRTNNHEYGDQFDLMGDSGSFHHFHPWYKKRAGWLLEIAGEIEVVPVETPGTYDYWIQRVDLDPLDMGGVAASALRVPRTPGSDLWVFYRGSDGPRHVAEGLEPGATLSLAYTSNIKPSHLLDMTPQSIQETTTLPLVVISDDYKDGDLPQVSHASTVPPMQQGVVDPVTGIRYTTLASYPQSIWVRVEVPAGIALDKRPVVDVVSPAYGETVSGVVTYRAEVYDPDCTSRKNGTGIASVTLELYPFDDTANGVLSNLRFNEPITTPAYACTTLVEPPYEMTVDTSAFIACTGPLEKPRNGMNLLVVTATARDGGVSRLVFNHIVDNVGPSDGNPPN